MNRELYLFPFMHSHIESEPYGPFNIIRGSISQGQYQMFIGFQVGESYPSKEQSRDCAYLSIGGMT